MTDVTLQFIKRWGINPEGENFQVSPKEKSRIDKFWEHGGQSPLKMTQSSKNAVKTSIPSCDARTVFSLDFIVKWYPHLSAIFVFSMDALSNCILFATDPVLQNCSTKRVTVDASSAVLPGYFC
ncbi:hypothetical protein TNCV_4228621 [Trichonephila clavipes]|nr:hypothetical protein TNCV_4228621 [Trichonephila clavipes]